MKSFILTILIIVFCFFNSISQKNPNDYYAIIAYCPVDGCEYLKNTSEECSHKTYRWKYNNLNWGSEYTLLDPYDGMRIFPKIKNKKKYFKIYYISENDHKIRKGTFEGSELEKMKVYKFKKRSHAKLFLKGKVCLTKSYR